MTLYPIAVRSAVVALFVALGAGAAMGEVKAGTAAEYEAQARSQAGDAWRGQQVFWREGRASCAGCHTADGHGGEAGPNLENLGLRLSRGAIVDSILHPSKRRLRSAAHAQMADSVYAAWSREDFTDLVGYLTSIKPSKSSVPKSFTPLFNGRDLTGWKPSPHWSVKNGMIEHDGVDGDLWSERDLTDFELYVEWRWPDRPKQVEFPVIDANGYELKTTEKVLDAGDSGVFLRGLYKAQANLFCYPIGSGEFWEYRESLTGEARRAVTPKIRADRPIGQWNMMRITVQGSDVTVRLNGRTVIEKANLPGLPARGPVGFQHEHGSLQVRAVAVRELK